VINIQSVVPSQ